ncbi:MAG: polysaccharide deacetylase family protein [Verrucomicrobiia bacterium]
MERVLIVSLHDVHPGSLETVREQVKDLVSIGVGTMSHLVVPEFHHGGGTLEDGATVSFLERRREAGDEMVVHGYFHDRKGLPRGSWFWTRVYSNDEAEFWELEQGEAERRLRAGRQAWELRGWAAAGFIAPGWLMGRDLEGVLRRVGYGYTTWLTRVVRLGDGQVTESQSLCYSTRSWWRVGASLAWNGRLFERLMGQRLIRLGLHPGDWSVPAIRRQALSLVRRALEQGYQPMTYERYVAL